MENNSEDFKILLNAAFDVSQIKKQLNNIKDLTVKVSVDTSGIKQSIQNAVNAAGKNIPNINIGTSSGNNRSGTNINTIRDKVDTKGYEVSFAKLEAEFRKLGESSDVAAGRLNEVKSTYRELAKALNGGDIAKATTAQEQLERQVRTLNSELAIAKYETQGYEKNMTEVARIKLANRIQNWLKKNTAATKESRQELQMYFDELMRGDTLESRGTHINSRFGSIDTQERAMGRLGKSIIETFKSGAKKFAEWTISSGAIVQSVQAVRKVITNVKELDTEMTELLKVSDATGAELQATFSRSVESAKELGASVRDVISATADWSRLGYSLPDSEELARIATLYKNVGDGIDIDAANKSLVSTLQGFQLEAKDALSIVDKFNKVANNFPIDTAGIGEALQNSAAAFNAANSDLSESIALITGTNSVVQDPAAVENMWKTVTMRIRGAKTELEEAGEDTEGMVESTAELQALVKGITGFDIMKDADTFKSPMEIIIGIGEAWKDLKDIDQAALLEALAGRRQGNALAATLDNIDMIKEAYATAEDSAGSAMREQENYEKSIQYSLDRLTASFEAFSTAIVNSDLIKWFVDFGATAVSALEKVINLTEEIPYIGKFLDGGVTSMSAITGAILGAKGMGYGKNSITAQMFTRLMKIATA